MSDKSRWRRVSAESGSPGEVFAAFLRLGLTSFGGPIAHLGYFRRELVARRGWVTESQFAQLLAICQFLPGPASSQVGFSLGLLRAGWLGGAAAFVAFTLPSALLMFAFAAAVTRVAQVADGALLHGLKLVALPIVAQGVFAMARSQCPDVPRMVLAAVSAALVVIVDQSWMQLLVIVLGAGVGLAVCRDVVLSDSQLQPRYGTKTAWLLLGIFLMLLAIIPLLARLTDGAIDIAAPFYRAGALVFGGAHVVLPLMEEAVVAPGLISSDDFLAGYGAAQAVPGPMFTFSVYVGARIAQPDAALVGAVVALFSMFLPGLLLVAGTLPLWRNVTRHPTAGRAVAGTNASVVGLLLAALYDPIWTSTVRDWTDVVVAAIGLLLLLAWRVSPLWIVVWSVGATVAAAMLTGA
jgi:chromate transporter